jgi:hypothetical protein
MPLKDILTKKALLFLSLLIPISGIAQVNEVPLMGLKRVAPYVFHEISANYYFCTIAKGNTKDARGLLPFSVALNKCDKNTHAITKTAHLIGDTVQTDSLLSYFAQLSCYANGRLFFAYNRIYPADTSLVESISLIVMDTNLNTIVPERRIKTTFSHSGRFTGSHLQCLTVSGNKLLIGYVKNDTASPSGFMSFYLITDFNGNVIKEDTIGIPPKTTGSTIRHELAGFQPYPQNRLLITGKGLDGNNQGVNMFLLADSNMNVLDTFYFKPAIEYGSGGYQGNFIQPPDISVLPGGNVIVGRDFNVDAGPSSVGSVITTLGKCKVQDRFDFDSMIHFPILDNNDNYTSSPSIHNLEYNRLDNRIYYANANRITSFTQHCLTSQNYIQVVCTDTNLHTYWRKFLTPNTNSCAVVTYVFVPDGRNGINVAGQFSDAFNPSDTSLQGSFLFHIDSTGTLDVKNQSLFNVRERFLIYPNPVTDILNIDDVENNIATVAVFNIQGRMIQQTAVTSHPMRLSIKDLVPGNYFILLRLKDGSTHSRSFSRAE